MNKFPYDGENDLPEFTNEEIQRMLDEVDREAAERRAAEMRTEADLVRPFARVNQDIKVRP